MIGATRALAGLLIAVEMLAIADADDQKTASGPRTASRDVIRGQGMIVPTRIAHVSALTSGIVRETLADDGAQVNAGDLLARLTAVEADLEVKRAAAALDRAKAVLSEIDSQAIQLQAAREEADAAVQQAVVQRDFQKHRFSSMRDLAKRESVNNWIAEEAETQLQVCEARVREAKARRAARLAEPRKERLAVARADVLAAEIQLDLARYHLNATEVRAPFSGTVLQCHIAPGDLVIGPTQHSPTVMFEIADLTQLSVVAELAEGDCTRVTIGMRADIRLESSPSTVLPGYVVRVAPSISPGRRTLPVRVKMDPPKTGNPLRPGMHVEVQLYPNSQ